MDAARAHVGRVPDDTVREWMSRNASVIRSLRCVLVSSMDSDRDVGRMTWAASRRADDSTWATSMSPLVLSGRSVLELLRDPSLFTGFDEIWVPSRLPVARPPDDAYLVAPRALDVESPLPISAWLATSRCRLGVGDGDGLNYAVSDERLGARLGLT
ncbi:hypothetical protein [Cellulomonas soli]|uniref:Uncharacterized protein n=1 Tax=Cellulomonas soli TaxID=931535 RepID=A0A512PCU5_9CELL|nr:hypothetical protein [Cellulomonas soli]NYI58602.1 hypothetical protein [Cellulomonas soli]GEP69027.1 hypothetical protein CSO01_17420 [Cellulomonas soli]